MKEASAYILTKFSGWRFSGPVKLGEKISQVIIHAKWAQPQDKQWRSSSLLWRGQKKEEKRGKKCNKMSAINYAVGWRIKLQKLCWG